MLQESKVDLNDLLNFSVEVRHDSSQEVHSIAMVSACTVQPVQSGYGKRVYAYNT